MGILDSFRKSREPKNHTTPPPVGHTLKEILQDKNKSHLFGKLLERDGHEDLALRIATGKLEESDIVLLEQQRVVFSEKLTHTDKIEKLLTKDNIIEFARNHPDFEKIVNLIGPEKAAQVIKNQLKDISITDESRFDGIASALETYTSYKEGDYKTRNDQVEKMCRDGEFTPQEYLKAIAITDPREKRKALQELANRTRSGFQAAKSFISFGKFGNKETADLEVSQRSMETSITELEGHHQAVGAMLFCTVSGNENMRNSLFGELANEKAPEEKKSGFSDTRKEAGSAFNESNFTKDWEEYKKKAGYATEDVAGQDIIKDMFLDEQKQAYKEKMKENKGFWASIFITFMEGMITTKKNTLN